MATHGLVKFIFGLLPFVSCFASTSERLKRRIAVHSLAQTLKPPACCCSRIFYQIFCPCYFSLRISMNYTENVTELLVHAWTVDTRRSSPQLPSAWERGYPATSMGVLGCSVLLQCSSIRVEPLSLAWVSTDVVSQLTVWWFSHVYSNVADRSGRLSA